MPCVRTPIIPHYQTPMTEDSSTTVGRIGTQLLACARSPGAAIALITVLAVAVDPVAAQSSSTIGSELCGTSLETGIGIVGGIVGGLGFVAGILFTARSGFKFMNANTSDQRRTAKQSLMYSLGGTALVILAVLGPTLLNNIIDPLGIQFSNCVMPF